MTVNRLIRRLALAACALALALAVSATAPASAGAPTKPGRRAALAVTPPYVPGQVIVGYRSSATALAADRAARAPRRIASAAPDARVVQTSPGDTVQSLIARLRLQPGVAYAVPNYIAHAAGSFIPNDPGNTHRRGGWQTMQWNFLSGVGVDAPGAWANLIALRHPGGRGATVAVLDTGVAYRDWRQFRKMPDFGGTRFRAPYDFVARNSFPLDREGHGTFVAALIAESTNDGYGLTGLAYGATVMPVRVLDASGNGDSATIARGIRYSADHGAQVINLSLEFPPPVSAGDIPDILNAIRYAHRRRAIVVAAAGNGGNGRVAYPARASFAVSVGATTRDRCLADYSDSGTGLSLVAPGGGDDSSQVKSPNCHPQRRGPNVYQLTMLDPANPRRFGYPGDYFGTSMSAAHVSAVAAMVIASGILGRHPTPEQILARLEATAQRLGHGWPNKDYGHGLLNAEAATNPANRPARTRRTARQGPVAR